MTCGPLRQAVVLAGGLGTRLGDLTKQVPKPMVEVAGKPFLEHLLRLFAARGFEEAVLLTGHLAEQMEAHFGDGAAVGLRVRYSREPRPLGTGGALRLAAPLLDPAFLLTYGDTWNPLDHRALADAWAERRPLAMVTAHSAAGTDVPRNLKLAADGRVLRYDKSDARGMDAVEAGVTVLRKAALAFLPREDPSSLEESVWPALAARNELRAFRSGVDFYDIGTPERLARIRAALA